MQISITLRWEDSDKVRLDIQYGSFAASNISQVLDRGMLYERVEEVVGNTLRRQIQVLLDERPIKR